MKEWLTVITSSPGRTPTASSARWSAVVQLATAQACGAPTMAANSRSKAATSGPCVTHPLRIERRAASASRSSIQGRATGIMRSALEADTRYLLDLAGRLPPGNQTTQPLIERHACLKTKHQLGLAHIGQPARSRVHLALRSILQRQIRPHDSEQRVGKVAQAGLHAARDVAYLVTYVCLCRKHVGPCDVLH